MGLYVGKTPLANTLLNRLRFLLQKLEVNCVLDVGAHFGEYGTTLRQLGYGGRIVSFEPVEASYELLSRTAAGDPDWTTRHFALGAEEATAEINVAAASDLSSFLPSSYEGERFGKGLTLDRREQVKIRPLSAVFEECVAGIDEPRVLLKMDTQGFDFEVLRGAEDVLGRISLLQSEVAAKPLYEGMTLLPEAIARYQDHGFGLAGLYPVSLELDNLRIIELDCLMVR